MTVLLDTDILVDYLRGFAPALEWLRQSSSDIYQIPGIVAMELVIGSRNNSQLQAVRELLSSYEVVWPEPKEFAHAFDLLAEHRLRGGMGIPDCLVAAMTLNRSATLYSFNIKHFRVVSGLDVREPYSRA